MVEIMHTFMDKNNELIPEKTAKKPIQVHKIEKRHLTKVIDVYVFKK